MRENIHLTKEGKTKIIEKRDENHCKVKKGYIKFYLRNKVNIGYIIPCRLKNNLI